MNFFLAKNLFAIEKIFHYPNWSCDQLTWTCFIIAQMDAKAVSLLREIMVYFENEMSA